MRTRTDRNSGSRGALRFGCFGLLAVALLASVSCQSTSEPVTGGETHFLRWCGPGSHLEVCGPGLVCLCNVCSRPCTDGAACGEFDGAECAPVVNAAACGENAGATRRCEVECSEDAQCRHLSTEHRCEQGKCRGPASECDGPSVSGNEVLVIGDSFFAVNHSITANLEALARTAGALGVGDRYRDNSSLLGNSLALGGRGIESQYTGAVEESSVRVVIMNGGGADVLIGSCDPLDASCAVLADAVQAARDLFTRMAADGVTDVVYAFYPDPNDGELRAEVDTLRPLLETACAESPVPCHWVDLRTAFAGHYAEYVQPDGINPTSEGARASASAIWETMHRRCIAAARR